MAAAPLQDFYRVETFTARCLAFACKRDRVPSFRRVFLATRGSSSSSVPVSPFLDVALKLRGLPTCYLDYLVFLPLSSGLHPRAQSHFLTEETILLKILKF